MNLRTVAFGCALIFALASLSGDALAQGRPQFKIKSIRRQQVEAPNYAASGTGAGQVEAVAVQLYYQSRLEDQDSEPQTKERWWEKFTPLSGYLLAPQETPGAVIGTDRFEAVKPTRQ